MISVIVCAPTACAVTIKASAANASLMSNLLTTPASGECDRF
jgi:hypothetical protein